MEEAAAPGIDSRLLKTALSVLTQVMYRRNPSLDEIGLLKANAIDDESGLNIDDLAGSIIRREMCIRAAERKRLNRSSLDERSSRAFADG